MLGVQIAPMVPMVVQGIIVVVVVAETIIIAQMGVRVIRDVVQGTKEFIETRKG
jgi:hypothetical protein